MYSSRSDGTIECVDCAPRAGVCPLRTREKTTRRTENKSSTEGDNEAPPAGTPNKTFSRSISICGCGGRTEIAGPI